MENTKICDTLNMSYFKHIKGFCIKQCFVPQGLYFIVLFSCFLSTSTNAQNENDQLKFTKQKHLMYINVLTGASFFQYQDIDNERKKILPEIGINAGSQIYFNKKSKRSKIGLDIEYANFSVSHLISSGMSLSVLRPGIVYSKIFKDDKSGLDFKVNAGAIVSALKEDAILGVDNMRNSYGWVVSTTIQMIKKRFIYGVNYQLADLDADGLQFHHRIDLSLGIRF